MKTTVQGHVIQSMDTWPKAIRPGFGQSLLHDRVWAVFGQDIYIVEVYIWSEQGFNWGRLPSLVRTEVKELPTERCSLKAPEPKKKNGPWGSIVLSTVQQFVRFQRSHLYTLLYKDINQDRKSPGQRSQILWFDITVTNMSRAILNIMHHYDVLIFGHNMSAVWQSLRKCHSLTSWLHPVQRTTITFDPLQAIS